MLYVALETQQKPYDQPVRQERATTCHPRLRFAGFIALRHASYPEPCSMQNYKYNHKYNSSSLTRRNKLHVTQQSHQSSTTVPSSTGEGRSVCMCVCVWLCDCATVSLDGGGASSAICSARGKFSDPMNSTKCSHPEVLVESCFWSGSAHFTAAPTGARQLPCKPRPVSLSFFPLPSPPGGLTSSFQTKILVMEQLSRCRHFLLRRLFFLFSVWQQ